MFSEIVLEEMKGKSRSTVCLMVRRLRELGVLEEDSGRVYVNPYSPFAWKIYYRRKTSEYVVLKALNASGGVLTGMKIAGELVPNPYSELPIFEVYVPEENECIFASIIGLKEDIIVYSRPSSLFNAPLSKTIVLAYPLEQFVDYEEEETVFGFKIREASLEQSLADILRNDYWYYRGIAFETYYYVKDSIDPEKLLETCRKLGLEKRLYTVDYIVSETLNTKPLFKIPENIELDKPLNIAEITAKLGDVLD